MGWIQTVGARLQHGWDAFTSRDPTRNGYPNYGYGTGTRIDRPRFHIGNERSIVASIYNRMAIDVSGIDMYHCRLDQNGRYSETIDSGLNNCLTLEANLDQTGRAFMQDVVMSMIDEGCVAIVPVETSFDPTKSASFEIEELRTGRITEWYPKHVRVSVYDEKVGEKKEIVLPKYMVAIVENPFYAVMNEPNSTLQRLIRKLNLLDSIDDQNASGKLDLIVQLPYTVRSKTRKEQAQERLKDVEMQLAGSKYGIAYIDATEKVTQLNRPVENNLLDQIQDLKNTLYSQLSMSENILNGTADEKETLNYYNQTIVPFLSAIRDEMKRKFLSKTARSQRQSIEFIQNPFKLVPAAQMAEIADKFRRNEILSTNEIRAIIGYKPSDDPRAEELRNPNLNASNEEIAERTNPSGKKDDKGE